MRRHKSLIPLSIEHRDFLLLAHPLKIGGPKYKGIPTVIAEKRNFTLEFYNNRIKPHIREEEELLFPMVSNIIEEIDLLIRELTNEHKELEQLMDRLSDSIEIEETMNSIGYLLDRHIRKEERQLFELIQIHASQDILNSISFTKLSSICHPL